MSVTHDLKTWPVFYERLLDGSKTFEVRKDDRGYQTGDTLRLREYDPAGDHDDCPDKLCTTKRYTGREMSFRVGFVFRQGFGADLGQHVVMSLLPPVAFDGPSGG